MTFKRLLVYLKPYKKQLICVIFIICISSICTILSPKIIANFISSLSSSVTNNKAIDQSRLTILLISLSSFYLINVLSSFIETYFLNNISEKIIKDIKKEANKKLSHLHQKYFDTHKDGELITRINNDTQSISYMFTQVIPKTISYSITFLGVAIIMFTINIPLTLITLICLPLTLLLSKLLVKSSKKKYKEYYTKNGQLNSLIEESYTNQQIISLYNNEEQISKSFSMLNKDLAKTNLKASFITNFINPLSSIINYSIYLIIIVLGSSYVLSKKLLIGDIYSFIQYTKQLSSPITGTSSLIIQAQNSLIAAERIFEILDEPEETHTGEKEIKQIDTIEFKNVTFGYDNTIILKNFNLSIKKGEKIAIVGETGSGKSTIINLLMQFYKVNDGDILINNESIYTYDLKQYYDNISLVPQDTFLFKDTIENNLKFSSTNISKENIEKACIKTKLYDCITNLNNNFNEIIDEDNQLLSQGQSQLLTITRALLKNHNLLILDEATSNTDSKTEKNIIDIIDNLEESKTCIIIAHKLSTILKADKIIVIKNGEIIEIGNHHTLYKQKGEYYNFFQTL